MPAMNSYPGNRENRERMTPVEMIGVALIAVGIYIVFLVLSELWAFYQQGDSRFIALITEKLGNDPILLNNGAPLILEPSGKYIVSASLYIFLAAIFAQVARNLINTGGNLLTERFERLKYWRSKAADSAQPGENADA